MRGGCFSLRGITGYLLKVVCVLKRSLPQENPTIRVAQKVDILQHVRNIKKHAHVCPYQSFMFFTIVRLVRVSTGLSPIHPKIDYLFFAPDSIM